MNMTEKLPGLDVERLLEKTVGLITKEETMLRARLDPDDLSSEIAAGRLSVSSDFGAITKRNASEYFLKW